VEGRSQIDVSVSRSVSTSRRGTVDPEFSVVLAKLDSSFKEISSRRKSSLHWLELEVAS